MQKKTFLAAILAMALVFGMSVISCDTGGGGEGSALAQLNWSTAPITPQALFASGLTQAQYNQIINAGSGSFLGWRIEYYSFDDLCGYCGYYCDINLYWLVIAWTGSSMAGFTSVANTVAALPNFTQGERSVYDGIHFASGWAEGIIGGIHGTGGVVEYGVLFFPRGQYYEYDDWLSFFFPGVYFPAGTLIVMFGDF